MTRRRKSVRSQYYDAKFAVIPVFIGLALVCGACTSAWHWAFG